jgi:hypothetical protein
MAEPMNLTHSAGLPMPDNSAAVNLDADYANLAKVAHDASLVDPHCTRHGHRLGRTECEPRYGPCTIQPGVPHPAEPINSRGALYRVLVAHLAEQGLELDMSPGAQVSVPVKGGRSDLIDTLLLENV